MLTGKRFLGLVIVPECSLWIRRQRILTSMIRQFDELIADKGFPWKLRDILPKALVAGEHAEDLLRKERSFLIQAVIKPGIPFCPPEGDAGTGMVARTVWQEE